MDKEAFLNLWSTEELPACEAGMELARTFVVTAAEGVDKLGTEEPEDRLAQITQAYMTMVNHGIDCDNCNEV